MTELKEPLSLLRGPQWDNRLTLAPLTNHQSNPDGTLHADEARWLRRRAEGGFGMVMTCAAHVAPEGQAFPGQLGAWDNRHVPGLTEVASAVHEKGSRAMLQLHHGGKRARADLSGLQPVAPWDDEATGSRALTTAEVEKVIDEYVAAAVRAEIAGFDGVEIHGAHGYLVGQFLAVQNTARADLYGGSLDNRMRFLFAILEGIRVSTADAFQVGLRLGPERSGIVLNEAVVTAAEVMGSGLIDFIDMSMWDVFKYPHEDEHSSRPLLDYFTEIPRHGVRLGVAGKILSTADAKRCLESGADFVLIGTGGIIHHDFAARALADASFVSLPQPVTRQHLRDEGLGEAFINYLANDWDDFVI